MAKTAKHEADEVIEFLPPDFDRALRIMNTDIRPAEEKSAKERGDLSAAWKAIEECHVNKSAAKAFHKLATASAEKKDDWLRSFYGLCQAAGLGISADLVDRMEADGEAPTMPIVETAREGLATLQPELTH